MAQIPNLESLNKGERFIVDWQYRLAGDFAAALAEAIVRADIHNLGRLAKGFPDEVDAYLCYTREADWWQEVQKKAGIVKGGDNGNNTD